MSRRGGILTISQMMSHPAGQPRPTLHSYEAMAVAIGIVLGAGIFRTPSLVAGAVSSEAIMLLAWLAGGLLSIVGALCYAELAAAYPHSGGDYHYLKRAFGDRLAFLHAWARLSVIQTGSIALLAFVFGDYAAQLVDLGSGSAALYAAIAVALLTAVNWAGIRQGTHTQNWLTAIEIIGLLLVVGAAFLFAPADPAPGPPPVIQTEVGLVLVFVLLTYGGWSEAVYLSAELRGGSRRIVPVLIGSLLFITILYLLVNLAYLRVLGLSGMAASDAVAADVMRQAFGGQGMLLISALVAVAALTSANATMMTGARTAYALGRDHPLLGFMGRWNERRGTPDVAVLVQGAAALLLVGLGSLAHDGFRTAVEYTAPVFWLFFLLVGVALLRLRFKEPNVVRPFRVPLYPFLPVIFCLTNAYLLYASLAYTGAGALVGVAVLVAGGLLLRPSPSSKETIE